MYKIMYNEIGRCGVAHRLRCYEDYCTCALASSALLSAVSLARAQFSGKRAQALFAGMATHSALSLEAPASAAVSLTLMAAGHASGWPILRGGAQTLVLPKTTESVRIPAFHPRQSTRQREVVLSALINC